MNLGIHIDARAPAAGLVGARATAQQLFLVPDTAGWRLVDGDGVLVYSAPGLEGRRTCLRFAHDEGVLALMT